MIPLALKTNVEAPSADYPYGSIKNNSGSNDGTPVDRVVYSDMHQFFAKLFAESLLVANNLPDNATNGFQLYEALRKVISSTIESDIHAFQAKQDPFSITASGKTVLTFSAEDFDIQSEYDPLTGRFTAKRAGYYQFHGMFTLVFTSISGAQDLAVGFEKNNLGSPLYGQNITASSTGVKYPQSANAIIYLNGSTDFVTFLFVQPNANSGSGFGHFSAHLIK